MFKNNRIYAISMVVQTFLPWLVVIFGICFMNYFWESSDAYNSGNYGNDYLEYQSLQETYELITDIMACVAIVAEWLIGVVMFFVMIIKIADKQRPKGSIQNPLACWIYANICILGTFAIRLFFHTFTYAMGI
ncbi:MAG: hypothetical protein E7264_09210 [Lachnospiraceae bacterium]|nr:hypothetical protein [Lachnospiraceae bacterium]